MLLGSPGLGLGFWSRRVPFKGLFGASSSGLGFRISGVGRGQGSGLPGHVGYR